MLECIELSSMVDFSMGTINLMVGYMTSGHGPLHVPRADLQLKPMKTGAVAGRSTRRRTTERTHAGAGSRRHPAQGARALQHAERSSVGAEGQARCIELSGATLRTTSTSGSWGRRVHRRAVNGRARRRQIASAAAEAGATARGQRAQIAQTRGGEQSFISSDPFASG